MTGTSVRRAVSVLVILLILGLGARYAISAIPAYRATSAAEPPAARVWVRGVAARDRPDAPDAARFAAHDEFGGARIGWGYPIELSEDVRVVYVAGRTVGFTWKDGFSGRDIEAEARYSITGVTRKSGVDTWWDCQLRHE